MSESDSSAEVSAHPGAILRAAREEMPLSIEQVADALHLRSTVVLSIERDEHEAFDSDVFLKGYYRSYCRLVGLHEERMVELLEVRLLAIKEDKAKQKEFSEKTERLRKRKKMLHQLLLAAGLLGAGAAVIYFILKSSPVPEIMPLQGTATNEKPLAQVSARSTETVVVGGGSELGFSESTAGQPAMSNGELVDESPNDQGGRPAEPETALQARIDPQSGIAELQSALGMEPQSDLLSGGVAPSVAMVNDAEVSAALLNDGLSGDVAGPALVVKFSGDCWFKLVNGEGRTPIAALQKLGDVVTYDGPKPYRLVLGDASVAEVAYLGENYDLVESTRRNGRAEFVLN